MNYKKKRLFIKSLLIAIVVLCFLAILMVSFKLYINSRIDEDVTATLTRTISHEADVVNWNIEKEIKQLSVIGTLIADNEKNGGAMDNIIRHIEENGSYSEIGMVDNKGSTVYGNEDRISSYPFESENITDEKAQLAYLKNTADNQKNTIVLASSVKTDTGDVYVIYAEINDGLSDRLLSEHQGDNMIVTPEGEVIIPIYSSNKTELINGVLNNEANKKKFEDVINNNKKVKFFLDDSGAAYITAKEINYGGWSVVSVFGEEEVATQIHNISKAFMYSMCLFSLIVLLFVLRVTIHDETAKLNMYKIAYIDSLTGLPNAEKFKRDGKELLNGAVDNYAVVILDIDNFKLVNELFGYGAGDQTLINIAKTILKKLRPLEQTCRINNDCFGILMRYDAQEELVNRVERMIHELSYMPANADYHLAVSCGIYMLSKGETSLASAIDGARMAMKAVKRKTVKITVYDKALKNTLLENKELEDDLDNALKNGDFFVYYQPKYDLITDKLAGAEALVRWKHKTKGMLPPAKFIPLFEANGTVGKIDLYMLEMVCKNFRKWIDEKKNLYIVSVNLSRVQLNNANLAEELDKIVSKYSIPKSLINFELTESAYFDDVNRLLTTMEKLKKMGYSISMDDFGTGYSSLSLLKQMPLDVLKLDKSFLYGWDYKSHDAKEAKLIQDIIVMAQHMDITTLAEGVETSEQRDFLKNAGCNLVQGFFYAKPIPAEEYEKLL